MGYRTHYSLEILNPETQEPIDDDQAAQIAEQLREENDEAEYALEPDGTPAQDVKWYDSDDDLREFSKQHPSLLFKLSGEGEENTDLWEKYFLDGKMQDCSATVVYPPYDASKLK